MALITCKSCGGQISDKASFCVHCGIPLTPLKKTCPACQAELPYSANFCPVCGRAFPPDGNNIAAPADKKPSSPVEAGRGQDDKLTRKQRKHKGLLIFFIIILSLVLLTAGGYFAYRHVNSDSINSQREDDRILDLNTGMFTVDFHQLATFLDFRLSVLLNSGLSCQVTVPAANEGNKTNHIIAISESESNDENQKRAAVIYGIGEDGKRADGVNALDIKRLSTVIYTDDPIQVNAVLMSLVSVMEKGDVTDEMITVLEDGYECVALSNRYPYQFTLDGVRYVLSKNSAGRLTFDVFADQ